MLPFFTCAGYSPQQCSSKHIFFGNSLASWFLKNRSSFWHWNRMNILLYSDGLTAPRQWFGRNLCIFFVLGDVGCCCFHQEKHNFTPMIWLIWEKWSMGHFLMGHSKGAVYSSSQNRESLPFGSQTFLIRDAPLNRWCIYINKQPSKKKSTI